LSKHQLCSIRYSTEEKALRRKRKEGRGRRGEEGGKRKEGRGRREEEGGAEGGESEREVEERFLL
jgi:hypothetical protein